jgi:hypothetical protein
MSPGLHFFRSHPKVHPSCLPLTTRVRFRVRIGPYYPLACRKRQPRRVVLRMRPEILKPCVIASLLKGPERRA